MQRYCPSLNRVKDTLLHGVGRPKGALRWLRHVTRKPNSFKVSHPQYSSVRSIVYEVLLSHGWTGDTNVSEPFTGVNTFVIFAATEKRESVNVHPPTKKRWRGNGLLNSIPTWRRRDDPIVPTNRQEKAEDHQYDQH